MNPNDPNNGGQNPQPNQGWQDPNAGGQAPVQEPVAPAEETPAPLTPVEEPGMGGGAGVGEPTSAPMPGGDDQNGAVGGGTPPAPAM